MCSRYATYCSLACDLTSFITLIFTAGPVMSNCIHPYIIYCTSLYVPPSSCLPAFTRLRRPPQMSHMKRNRVPRPISPRPSQTRGKPLTKIPSQGASFVSRERCGQVQFQFVPFPLIEVPHSWPRRCEKLCGRMYANMDSIDLHGLDIGEMRSRPTFLRLVQPQWRPMRVQGAQEARLACRLRT